MKYFKRFKLVIVLLVTCHPQVNALISTKHGFNFFSKSASVGMKHDNRYKLRSCTDCTKLHKCRYVGELDYPVCTGGISNLTHAPTNSRRELLRQCQLQTSSLILASLIIEENKENAQAYTAIEPFKSKTIVITGANSGIGFEACKRLSAKGHTIILACRSLDKAHDAVNRIQEFGRASMNGKLIPAECDLADLSSIRKFVTNVATNNKIDTLCLNAGVARNTAATDCVRTNDGFELTGTLLN
jgi:short chain dehydrogenase